MCVCVFCMCVYTYAKANAITLKKVSIIGIYENCPLTVTGFLFTDLIKEKRRPKHFLIWGIF